MLHDSDIVTMILKNLNSKTFKTFFHQVKKNFKDFPGYRKIEKTFSKAFKN